MSELGDLLRKLRGKESLRDAARRAGVSHTYLSILEKGYDLRTKSPVHPTPETLKRLAKAYNYSYEQLMKIAGYIDDNSDITEEERQEGWQTVDEAIGAIDPEKAEIIKQLGVTSVRVISELLDKGLTKEEIEQLYQAILNLAKK